MYKKLILAAAALALSAPVLADPHRKHFDGKHFDRGHHHGDRGHHHGHRHHYYHAPRRVVVMPPPRVYYAPPPRVYYAPPPRVYYAPAVPVYRHSVPHGGVSISFNIPF